MADHNLIDAWAAWSVADAERRGSTELKSVLEAFARAARVLRSADWNRRADDVGKAQTPNADRQRAPERRHDAPAGDGSHDA